MSEQIKDGGQAFPIPNTEHASGHQWAEYGMSLRDFFAAKAMASMDYNHSSDDVLARDCYRFADAMLAAREAKS